MGKTAVCRLIVMLGVWGLLAFPAGAAETGKKKQNSRDGSFSLTATVGGYLFAGSENLRATPLYGVKLGYDMQGRSIADSLGIEVSYSYLSTSSTKSSDDTRGHLVRLDVTYPFTPGARLVPFIAVGGGALDLITASRSNVDPLLNYGGGLKYLIEDYLAVRGDVRQLLVYHESHFRNNFEFVAGLTYYFGKERKKKAVTPPPPPKPDKGAGSGKVSGTGGASAVPVWPTEGSLPEKLEKAGVVGIGVLYPPADKIPPPPAPPLAPPAPAAPAIPADPSAGGDGSAAAKMSEQAATGGSTDAAAPGTVAEGPGGGAPSSAPETASAAPVAPPPERPIEQRVSKVTEIDFDKGSSFIKPEYYRDLIDLSLYLKAYPDAFLTIEGQGDLPDSREAEEGLSRERADSVRQKLLLFGIEPERLIIREGKARHQSRQGKHRAIITIDPFDGQQ
ncbi:OmpA family protein [Geobacter sp. SVR]|uniref:OmpA family protein n=1 Tax=Geobacter sp. SVR TaxID=2495594 RepID=UPI00143EFFCC|nr:OmpA family protein [Geobacter sp. SVR]BCS53257.1 hypothetical protein GSVR_15650 [Geobacter sp. SVR]GCF84643.1 hypothetical protein GSbR_12430 [Geobacter sp. SVR]